MALSTKGQLQEWLQTLQATVTVIAICSAGIWFLLQGEGARRLNISHQINHRQLDAHWQWLTVQVTIENVGKRQIRLDNNIVRVLKVKPLPAKIKERIAADQALIPAGQRTVDWPRIGPAHTSSPRAVILPGEKDTIDYDFILPVSIQTVKVYSFFGKEEEADLGWQLSSLYDLKTGERP